MNISIDGTLVCGETVVGSYEYAGGKEGYSQIAWYLHQVWNAGYFSRIGFSKLKF